MASHSAVLSIKILTDAKDAAKGIEQASSGVDKWKGRISAAAKVATGVLVGLGAAAFSFGKAAAEDAQGAAVLAQALKNTTGATKDQVGAVEDWISKTALATGVADDKLRPALGTLARATGSVEDSQKGLSQALDISAATGKDVGSVAEALAKGYAGNTTSLGRLVPGIDKATLASGNMKKIMKELADQTGGSSAAAADTAAGRMARMQVAMDETKESLGAALLPLMGKLATILGKVAGFAQEHSKAFTVIAGVVAVVAGAIVILNAALSVQKTILALSEIQWLATWAAAALPVVLVIAAIAALVLVFVILYNKVGWFRDFVDATWAAIKAAFAAAVDFIKKHWLLLLGILTGPLGLVVVTIIKNWDKIKAVAVGVWNAIKSVARAVFQALSGLIRSAVDTWRGLLRSFEAVVRGVWNAIKAAARAVWSAITGVIRNVIDGWRNIINGFRTMVVGVWNGIKAAARTVWGEITGFVRRAVEGWERIFRGLGEILAKPFHIAEEAVKSLMGWVGDLLDKISRIKIPGSGLISHIPGLGRSAPTVPGPAYAGDPSLGAFLGPRPAATATASTGGPTIVVQGALDPEAVARQIKAILAGHERRMGLAGRAI